MSERYTRTGESVNMVMRGESAQKQVCTQEIEIVKEEAMMNKSELKKSIANKGTNTSVMMSPAFDSSLKITTY